MECGYFGKCGSCRDYAQGYEGQFERKKAQTLEEFSDAYEGAIACFASPQAHFRARAEFRIWHEGDRSFYAMHGLEAKTTVMIERCGIVRDAIDALMPRLLEELERRAMTRKLFGIDFLSSRSGEIAVTLIYHTKLDAQWRALALELSEALGVHIIGRSRGEKVVLTQDYVTESLHVRDRTFHYRHIENSFTQPNPAINEAMMTWAMEQFEGARGDLLELYCGAGNFTIPFATHFDRVLATEISKASIAAAKVNMELNDVHNIDFVRLGVEEFVQALEGVRSFRRMEGVELGRYRLSSLFVDPPRAGMDENSLRLARKFETIVYISCNPQTLKRDLDALSSTHGVAAMALFDQFPYTHHREMGVKLIRKEPV
ncbi:MAG: tRNA (uridine(54)-C5)-methyltransferase TrmA [Campylobacterales bacterium]|nr:tRNA (uridine(54)-C5)-methyltransferase TrmA [Campylobacterales bacterium]